MYVLLYTSRPFHPLPIASVSSCEAELCVWRIFQRKTGGYGKRSEISDEQLRDKRELYAALPLVVPLSDKCAFSGAALRRAGRWDARECVFIRREAFLWRSSG